MQVLGEWLECDDGIVRPVVRGEVLRVDGAWEPEIFLLDTGADRTVSCATLAAALTMPSLGTTELGGMGGLVRSMSIRTQIRLTKDDGLPIALHGEYAALSDVDTLDMSVLGRDVTGLFAVIVDRTGRRVALIGQGHTYQIIPR